MILYCPFSSGSWQYQSGCMRLFFHQPSAKVRERERELRRGNCFMEFEEEGETEETVLYYPLLLLSLLLPLSPLFPSPPFPSPFSLSPPPSLLPYPASYHKSLFATRSPMVEGVGEGGGGVPCVPGAHHSTEPLI